MVAGTMQVQPRVSRSVLRKQKTLASKQQKADNRRQVLNTNKLWVSFQLLASQTHVSSCASLSTINITFAVADEGDA